MPELEFNPAIFRAYDIRGVADRDLHTPVVRAIGGAFATAIGKRRGRKRIAVGRDCRLTSPRLFEALTRGLIGAGAEVIDVGVVPSPVLYFAAHHLQTDGAIIITGSHNPAEDNGLKMMCGTESFHSEDIAELLTRIESNDIDVAEGSLSTHPVADAYLDNAVASLEMGPRRFRIAVDAGHGAAGPLAVELYRRLGFEVLDLYCEMDGRFPAHHPDPTVEANLEDLRTCVRTEEAELGLALDGDGDRLGAVDGRGRILWGDQLMLLFGREIADEVPGATFIAEVKCSQALFDGLRKAGGNPIMWKVGHSLIKAKMKETGAVLAGEMSGHLFFAHRYLGFDDGLYAGARLLELVSKSPRSLAELYDELPATTVTPEIRVDCPDDHKFLVVERVANELSSHPQVSEVITIDGVRARFSEGWGLVRASNTQPVLVLRAEASSSEALERIRALIEEAIRRAQESL